MLAPSQPLRTRLMSSLEVRTGMLVTVIASHCRVAALLAWRPNNEVWCHAHRRTAMDPTNGLGRRKSSGNGCADLVIYFGERDVLRSGDRFAELRAAYPAAHMIGGSATATILGGEVDHGNVVAAAISFAGTRVAVAQSEGVSQAGSRACGEEIGRKLAGARLGRRVRARRRHGGGRQRAHSRARSCARIRLSDHRGHDERSVRLHYGSLAGVDAPPASGVVAAVGFYGPKIRVACGRGCGWDAFGPRRRITRSSGNVLFELDEKPALGLYERYIGEDAGRGTSAGVIYPLLISPPDRPSGQWCAQFSTWIGRAAQ